MNRIARILEYFSSPPLSSVNDEDGSVLRDAIYNATLIIITASENGIPLAPDTIRTVMITKEHAKKKSINAQVESEFWIAYEQIAQAIQPITINSIKANLDVHSTRPSLFGFIRRKNIPLSRRCASNYKIISLVTLFLLIIIQIYWYVGWSITTDIIAQAQAIRDLQASLTLSAPAYKNTDPSVDNVDPSVLEIQQMKIRRKIEEHKNWKEAASYHLENWNEVWSSLDIVTLQIWQNSHYETFPLKVQRRLQYVSAGNFLQAITAYILPILYGLIGACFYILRQLPKEIESLTFSMNSYIDYSLRMAQGPLAGILTTYLLTSGQEKLTQSNDLSANPSETLGLNADLSTLSPLAVAFIAGYSVEFIFRFIDKMLTSPALDPASTASDRKELHWKKQTNQRHFEVTEATDSNSHKENQ